jgi:hypothetical protein
MLRKSFIGGGETSHTAGTLGDIFSEICWKNIDKIKNMCYIV